MTDDQLQNQALLEIEKLLFLNENSLRNFSSMPFLDNNNFPAMINRLIQDEMSYDRHVCGEEHSALLPKLTSEQRKIYDRIMAAVDSNVGGVFFVYGFDGTGKTFIWQTLSTYIRSREKLL